MITSSIIGNGNQLGAQMSDVASLYFLARENNQDLVFIDEFSNWRRGYQFYKVFDLDSVKIRRTHIVFRDQNIGKDWKANYRRIYKSRLISKFELLVQKMVMQIKYSDFQKICGTGGIFRQYPNKSKKRKKL